MDKKDRFETYGFRNNRHADSYIIRILDREHGYSRITLDKEFGETFGTFIKPSAVSRLGWGYCTPDKKAIEILTFNVPDEGIAYKFIYDGKWSRKSDEPIKIFSSVAEGKWTRVETPTNDLINRFKKERARISNYVEAQSNVRYEGPVPWDR